jgi:hypothetical protein
MKEIFIAFIIPKTHGKQVPTSQFVSTACSERVMGPKYEKAILK